VIRKQKVTFRTINKETEWIEDTIKAFENMEYETEVSDKALSNWTIGCDTQSLVGSTIGWVRQAGVFPSDVPVYGAIDGVSGTIKTILPVIDIPDFYDTGERTKRFTVGFIKGMNSRAIDEMIPVLKKSRITDFVVMGGEHRPAYSFWADPSSKESRRKFYSISDVIVILDKNQCYETEAALCGRAVVGSIEEVVRMRGSKTLRASRAFDAYSKAKETYGSPEAVVGALVTALRDACLFDKDILPAPVEFVVPKDNHKKHSFVRVRDDKAKKVSEMR
jgi:hypothetical protein